MRGNISTEAMAELLGTSGNYVSILGRQGVLHREPDGLWNPKRTKKAYLDYKASTRKGPKPRVVTLEDYGAGDGDGSDNSGAPGSGPARGSLAEARLRKDTIDWRLKDLQFREKAGELVLVTDVQRFWGAQISSIKNSLLLLPPKLASKLAAESEVLEVQAILDSAIRQILTELSQYHPSPHKEAA